jgi:hypothetical protein
MFKSKLIYAIAISATLLSYSNLAHAQVDAKAVGDAVIANMGSEKTIVTIASSEMSGNNVVLKGIAASDKDGKAVTIGDVTLENVSEVAEGFKAEKISSGEFNFADSEAAIKIAGWSMSNVVFSKDGKTPENPIVIPIEGLNAGAIDFSLKGNPVVHIDSVTWAMTPVQKDQPIDVNFKASGLTFDFSKTPDVASLAVIEALGIQTVKGQITATGSWNPTDGHVQIKEESFDFENIGRLNMALDITGYTTDVAKQIALLSKSGGKEADAAKGFLLLGLAQKLTFNTVSLRFDDASITNRVLDFVSKKAGQPREAYVAQLKAMAPMLVMQLQEPDLMAAATQAVSTYLDNPKNIEIKSVQSAPIPLDKLMSGAMSPPELIKQLGITITANQ